MGTILLFCLLAFSVALNGYLFYKVYTLKKLKNHIQMPTAELKAFIADVVTGKLGMIAVTRVDTENILYRSPRQL